MNVDKPRLLVLDGRVPPGCRRLLEDFFRESRGFFEAPGGINVRLWWDRDDPDRFRHVIQYDAAADEEADDERIRNDPTMRGYLNRYRSLLAAPPRARRWHEVELARGAP